MHDFSKILTNFKLVFKKKFKQGYDDLLVLSLGTGQQIQSYDTKEVAKWGVFKWMAYKGDAPLVDMVFNASADMVDYNLSIIFASQKSSRNYLRIQVTFLCKLSLSLSPNLQCNVE